MKGTKQKSLQKGGTEPGCETYREMNKLWL